MASAPVNMYWVMHGVRFQSVCYVTALLFKLVQVKRWYRHGQTDYPGKTRIVTLIAWKASTNIVD